MTEPRNDSEDRLLKRLRVAAGVVILTALFLMVVLDNFGRLFIDPTFHVSDFLFSTLVGALLAIVGVEILARLPRRNGNGNGS